LGYLTFQLLELRNTHVDILGSSNTVQQGIDVVVENIKWMELHQNEIGNWLADNIDEPTTISTSTTTTTTTTTVQPTASSTTTTTTQATPSSANGNAKMNTAFILAVIFSGIFFKP
jgi:hypothetical protein